MLARLVPTIVKHFGTLQAGTCFPAGMDFAKFLMSSAFYEPNIAERCDLLFVDASNAYNSVNRRQIKNQIDLYFPSLKPYFNSFYTNDNVLVWNYNNVSTEFVNVTNGVVQGDVLGSLFHNLAVHPLYQYIQRALPNIKIIGIHDDLAIGSNSPADLLAAIDIIKTFGPNIGYNLNCNKTFILCQSHDKDQAYLESPIKRIYDGAKYLGCPIGTPAYINKFLDNYITKLTPLVIALRKFPLVQITSLLFTKCFLTKPLFFQRCIPYHILQHFCKNFQELALNIISNVFAHGNEISTTQRKILTLPIGKGGYDLGISEISSNCALVAAYVQCYPHLSKCNYIGLPPYLNEISNYFTSPSIQKIVRHIITNCTGKSVPTQAAINSSVSSNIATSTQLITSDLISSTSTNITTAQLINDITGSSSTITIIAFAILWSKINIKNRKSISQWIYGNLIEEIFTTLVNDINTTKDDKSRLLTSKSITANKFLTAIPFTGNFMTNVNFLIAIQNRFGFGVLCDKFQQQMCFCGITLCNYTISNHCQNCMKINGANKLQRHNTILMCISQLCLAANVPCTIKNIYYDNTSNKSTDGSFVQINEAGEYIVNQFDLKVINTRSDSANERLNPLQTAYNNKNNHHKAGVEAIGHQFLPLIVSSYGEMHSAFIEFIENMCQIISEKGKLTGISYGQHFDRWMKTFSIAIHNAASTLIWNSYKILNLSTINHAQDPIYRPINECYYPVNNYIVHTNENYLPIISH